MLISKQLRMQMISLFSYWLKICWMILLLFYPWVCKNDSHGYRPQLNIKRATELISLLRMCRESTVKMTYDKKWQTVGRSLKCRKPMRNWTSRKWRKCWGFSIWNWSWNIMKYLKMLDLYKRMFLQKGIICSGPFPGVDEGPKIWVTDISRNQNSYRWFNIPIIKKKI